MPADPVLSDDDRALLARVAARVVELRLEVPAVLAIETATPLSVVAGQAMLFFEPFIAAFLPVGEWRRFAKLTEQREALAELATLIETGAGRAHAERRAAKAARRAARTTGGA
jgi:hypothetical protein